MSFAHLHTHSEYSPIDSLAKVKDLVKYAVADGNPALAVTDHGTLGGIWKLTQAAAAAGIKAIPGLEAYLAIGSRFEKNALQVENDDADPDADDKGTKSKKYEHLTLLAISQVGWRNLVLMANEAQSPESYWYKPRIDYDLLAEHGEGIVVLTGCLGGPVAGPLSRGDRATAVANARRLIECVGKENVYVEVMDHGIDAQLRIMGDLRSVAAELDLPLVATNDSHYIHPDQGHAHEAWLAVGTRAKLSDTKRFKFHGHGHHLRTEAEMRALSAEDWWQKACDETVRIAERAAADILPPPKLRLPRYPVPDGFADAGEYLKHLVRQGAFARYGADEERSAALGKPVLPAAVNTRLKFEFGVVDAAGLPDYFLIVNDIIDWARSDRGLPTAEHPLGEPGKKKPIRVGPGRGSAAGACLSYCLGIVGVDPLANNLLFERFLNPQRTGMPDIDVDFEQGRRPEVLRYVERRFGRDRVARIGTFGAALSRAALKDAARVLDVTPLADRLSKLVPIGAGTGKPVSFKALDDTTDKAGEAFRTAVVGAGEIAETLLPLARAFEGVTKQEGIHACGTLIADEPMAPLVPLRRDRAKGATDEDLLVTVWDGKDVDAYGLLKMDVLGLRNLDVVSAAVDFIHADTGELVDPDTLVPGSGDERDQKTWDLIAGGRTAGVFQLESAGMTRLAEAVAPNSLADLTALVALYRPGPMAAGMPEHYAARKNGREAVSYDYLSSDPAEQAAIASVLDVTYGTCLAGDTPVYSVTRGRYVAIRDIEVGESVQGVDEATLMAKSAPVTHKVRTGTKDTVVTRFRGGTAVRSTPDHLFLTPDGWRRADELTADSVVAAPWSLESASTRTLTASRARMLGYLLGDGYLGAYGVTFINADSAMHDAFTAAVKEAFPDTAVRFLELPGRTTSTSRITNGKGHGGGPSGAMRWLRELDLMPPAERWREGGKLSGTKFVPPAVMAADDASLAVLVAALWDCDGHFGAGHGAGTATYKTISADLARDVQTILLRLGVVSNRSGSAYMAARGSQVAHQITVSGEHLHRLAAIVAPHLASHEKRAKAVEIAASAVGVRAGMHSDVPRAAALSAVKATGMSLRAAAFQLGIDPRSLGSGNLTSAHTTERVASAVHHLTGDADLGRLLNTRWVRVLDQEPAEPTEVWDITVAGIHNFVAAGVIVHNCVYQEQLMQLSEVVGGLGPADRNKLQKAFSKKDAAKMAEVKTAMFDGALAGNGTSGVRFSQGTLDRLWTTFEGSAAYLFNASHACAYGFVSYQTAYLKANWPTQYGAALLACTDGDDKRALAIRSLQVEGVQILPPDINRSQVDTHTDGDSVRLGLSEVKGVGKDAVHIVAEREKNGPFTGFADVMARVVVPGEKDAKGNRKMAALASNKVEVLIEAGAFDEFGPRLGQLMVARGAKVVPGYPVPDAEWGILERSARQRSRLGLVTGAHPLVALKDQIRGFTSYGQKPLAVSKVEQCRDGERVLILGVLSGWAQKAYRKGQMVTLTLEGSKESVEGTMWDEDRRRLESVPTLGSIIVVQALVRVRLVETERIDEDGETVTDSFERRDLNVKRVVTVPVEDHLHFNPARGTELTLPQGFLAVPGAVDPEPELELADAPAPEPVEPTDDERWGVWDDDVPVFEPPDFDDRYEPGPGGEPEPLATVTELRPAVPELEIVRLACGSLVRTHPALRAAVTTHDLPAGAMHPDGGVWVLTVEPGRALLVVVGSHDVPDAAHLLPGETGWSPLHQPQSAAA